MGKDEALELVARRLEHVADLQQRGRGGEGETGCGNGLWGKGCGERMLWTRAVGKSWHTSASAASVVSHHSLKSSVSGVDWSHACGSETCSATWQPRGKMEGG